MATIQIPDPFVPGLIKIGGLGDAPLRELVQALPDVPVSARDDELIESIAPKVTSVPKEDLREIIRALVGLAQARIQLELDTTEIIPLVCNAMERSANPDLKRTAQECTAFGDRLTELLKIESLEPLAKVAFILTDHDCVFLQAHTLTDIRAIFGRNTEALPKAATITHMLAIAYQRNLKRETFYVALNSKDVETLTSTLTRATSKEKGLKTLLEAAHVPFVNTE